MLSVGLIGTERIGQLTGSTDPTWPRLVDWQGWPLLQDTGAWGVVGVDLGANTEHSDGRLYFFFGDVATHQRPDDPPLNSDLVAWTDDTQVLRHGGHLAIGWNFFLPNDHQGATAATGQPDWRFCGKCHGLFYAPHGDPAGTVCPTDGSPHLPLGWNFILPNDHQGATATTGQPDWRYCAHCHGLFWNGDGLQGVCPGAPGGGFRLHPVLDNRGKFDPFVAQEPIRLTLSNETPNGAFSYNGRAYVFAGFPSQYWRMLWEQPRPGDPAAGCYLVSKERPDLPSNPNANPVPPIPPNAYRKEFLFSPRIGWCPRNQSRDRLESHEILGLKFALPHDVSESPTRQANWRLCHKCGAMFWDSGPTSGRCHRGGSHELTPSSPNYCLPHDISEDIGNQGNWRLCSKCSSLFWNGDPNSLCPAGGNHQAPATALNFVLPHDFAEDATTQGYWRFCGKCHGMFWDGDHLFKGFCPKDGKPHEAIGLTFALRHDLSDDPYSQKDWAFCGNCAGLFWNGDPHGFKGVCPKGGSHAATGSFNFVLSHDVNDDPRSQKNWAFCGKCAGLFFDGYSDKGSCPKGGGHSAPAGSFNFVLPHNPGSENEADWRFCIKCHGMVKTGQEDIFTWVAPIVVNNVDHPELPPSPYPQSLVIFGFGFSGTPGIRLAWMPLRSAADPMLQDVLYYTGQGSSPWSSEVADAVVLLPHRNEYTHLSAAWLPGPKCWIVLYGTAVDNIDDLSAFRRPAMARFSTTLFPVSNWTAEIEIFNPDKAGAYTQYMHDPGKDTINPDVPPMEPPPQDYPGWAYGVFILNRFTEWNESERELGIYYLLSTKSPYQVHLMHTRLNVR